MLSGVGGKDSNLPEFAPSAVAAPLSLRRAPVGDSGAIDLPASIHAALDRTDGSSEAGSSFVTAGSISDAPDRARTQMPTMPVALMAGAED